jgi:hypothetical protein
MAVIQFWDEPDIPEAKRHKDDAALIVNALNSYGRHTPDTGRRVRDRQVRSVGRRFRLGR